MTRGGFCSLPYSQDKAHLGASQGQKKFQRNTEEFTKSFPNSSRTWSLEQRRTASCSRSGRWWTESHRADPSKHGRPWKDRKVPAASAITMN
eukprot:747653-Alexandrium_andersonii.AAC.1